MHWMLVRCHGRWPRPHDTYDGGLNGLQAVAEMGQNLFYGPPLFGLNTQIITLGTYLFLTTNLINSYYHLYILLFSFRINIKGTR